MMLETVPEILRTHLTNTVLYLKMLGIGDVLSFDFLDPPSQSQVLEALVLLHQLGAIDDTGHITSVGQQMATLPLEPSLSRAIIAAVVNGCVEETVTVAAMLSVDSQSIFVEPAKGSSHRYDGMPASHKAFNDDMEQVQNKLRLHYGDHMTYLNVFMQWRCEGNCSKKWCEDNYINFRSLSTAMKIRCTSSHIVCI